MDAEGRTTCNTVLLSEPRITGWCLCVLKEHESLAVSLDESTDKYYKVWTESGVEGYCLRHQIKLKEKEDEGGRQHT